MNKIKTEVELNQIIAELRSKNKKIVWTNGCFDILHIGHVYLLEKAKSFGDILIVGLNSDSSIKRLKGDLRPVIPQDERAKLLEAIQFIDYIIIFEDDTPCRLIKEFKPDIHVKGGDYSATDYKRMPEAEIIHNYGGRVEIIPLIQSKSTSSIIQKINNS